MSRLNIYTLFLFIILTGCTEAPLSTPPSSDTDDHPTTVPGTDTSEPDLTPISASVVYASGWSELVIGANSAKTTVSIGSHFATTRNACGKDAYGALDLDAWNDLSKNLNLALQKEPLREPTYCVLPSVPDKYVDEGVIVKIQGPQDVKTRILYEFRDNQICSTISDPQVSDALLSAIHKVIPVADKEDCPHGWGS